MYVCGLWKEAKRRKRKWAGLFLYRENKTQHRVTKHSTLTECQPQQSVQKAALSPKMVWSVNRSNWMMQARGLSDKVVCKNQRKANSQDLWKIKSSHSVFFRRSPLSVCSKGLHLFCLTFSQGWQQGRQVGLLAVEKEQHFRSRPRGWLGHKVWERDSCSLCVRRM